MIYAFSVNIIYNFPVNLLVASLMVYTFHGSIFLQIGVNKVYLPTYNIFLIYLCEIQCKAN